MLRRDPTMTLAALVQCQTAEAVLPGRVLHLPDKFKFFELLLLKRKKILSVLATINDPIAKGKTILFMAYGNEAIALAFLVHGQ
jgi:hypothetical protein